MQPAKWLVGSGYRGRSIRREALRGVVSGGTIAAPGAAAGTWSRTTPELIGDEFRIALILANPVLIPR
jgi:hypothetical protein